MLSNMPLKMTNSAAVIYCKYERPNSNTKLIKGQNHDLRQLFLIYLNELTEFLLVLFIIIIKTRTLESLSQSSILCASKHNSEALLQNPLGKDHVKKLMILSEASFVSYKVRPLHCTSKFCNKDNLRYLLLEVLLDKYAVM